MTWLWRNHANGHLAEQMMSALASELFPSRKHNNFSSVDKTESETIESLTVCKGSRVWRQRVGQDVQECRLSSSRGTKDGRNASLWEQDVHFVQKLLSFCGRDVINQCISIVLSRMKCCRNVNQIWFGGFLGKEDETTSDQVSYGLLVFCFVGISMSTHFGHGCFVLCLLAQIWSFYVFADAGLLIPFLCAGNAVVHCLCSKMIRRWYWKILKRQEFSKPMRQMVETGSISKPHGILYGIHQINVWLKILQSRVHSGSCDNNGKWANGNTDRLTVGSYSFLCLTLKSRMLVQWCDWKLSFDSMDYETNTALLRLSIVYFLLSRLLIWVDTRCPLQFAPQRL